MALATADPASPFVQAQKHEVTEVALPTRDGPLRMLALSDDEDETSVAVLTGHPEGRRGVLLYGHIPCLFGDALGSTACAGRVRLDDVLTRMRAEGSGTAVYHREPDAGITGCGGRCAGGATTPPALSDGAVAALARAVRALDLRAVRLISTAADGRRAARAGIPIGERIDLPNPSLGH
jgi:hypothetical protein